MNIPIFYSKSAYGFGFVALIYFILFIGDVTTTLMLGETAGYLELNPLYKYGGFIGIIIINFVVMGVAVYWYCTTKNVAARWSLMYSMIFICALRIWAISQAVSILQNPPTLAEAQIYASTIKPTVQKTVYYNLIINNLYPFIITWFTQYFYSKDHNITIKEE